MLHFPHGTLPRMTSRLARLTAALILLLHGAATIAQSTVPLRPLVGTTATGLVTAVLNGDTFDIALDGRPGTVRVRTFGIDAPERGEPYSNVALRQARVLLFNQRVTITGRDVDRYDRLVASVRAGGQDVGAALMEAGLACHFTRYSHEASLAEAEARARTSGAGFWAPGAPKPRCVTTAATPGGPTTTPRGLVAAGPFHGNVNSRVYHAPHCRNYRCKNCTQVFASEDDAQRGGYRPAQDCLRR